MVGACAGRVTRTTFKRLSLRCKGGSCKMVVHLNPLHFPCHVSARLLLFSITFSIYIESQHLSQITSVSHGLCMRHCQNTLLCIGLFRHQIIGRSCSRNNFTKQVLKFIISYKNIIQKRYFKAKASLEPPQRKRLWWRLEHLACRPPYSPPKITVKPLL